ncbi:MAG: sulfotransferase domain-containing protein [Kangiellaceae bacterium]|nr:sulfotransferase domain-containing protein [Kangiellaceae bacterium]
MLNFFIKDEYQEYHTQKFKLNQLSKNIDKHIWLVCAPKSGSTWLTRMLHGMLKWDSVKLVPSFGNREQELDLSPLLAKGTKGNLITPHQHCRYSAYTHEVIDALDTKVILQVRDIFDTVISFYDHIENEGPTFPSGFMNQQSWDVLDEHARWSYLVDLVIPWYFNFYCSWMTSPLYKENRIKIVTYNELRNNTVNTVGAVLDFCGESRKSETIQAVIDKLKKKNTRQNKGIVGRGDTLPDELKDRIRSFTRYYPSVDFEPMGL